MAAILLGLEVLFGTEEPWPSINPIIASIIGGIFLLIIALLLLLRMYYRLKDEKAKAHQLFLFKAKKIGLSNYQFKILKGLVDIIALGDPNKIYSDPSLYERAIGAFLSYLASKPQESETALSICRDIIIIHEKIFNPASYRKPLTAIDEIGVGALIALFSENNDACIAKVHAIQEKDLALELFRKEGVPARFAQSDATLYLWRTGDAEYTAPTKVLDVSGKTVRIQKPAALQRGKEERLPYLDVMIPCVIEPLQKGLSPDGTDQREDAAFSGMMYKINEHESVVRVQQKINYNTQYALSFTLEDFNIKFTSSILSEKTVQEQNAFFITFRFIEGTDIARQVLKRYLTKHLEEM